MSEYENLYYPRKEISRLQFDPQEDMTAYELALLMPLIIPSMWKTEKSLISQYGQLPEKCKRHVKIIYK
jgi:hypothetical protein